MPLVDMKDMLQHAYNQGYAIGAFDIVSLDVLEGVMLAADRAHAPVILSLAESHFSYIDFELLMSAIEAAAKRASVPVAIYLKNGTTLESAVRAINFGCNGVMVDTNIANTRKVVEMALGCGVSVEGKLECVPRFVDTEYNPAEAAFTTPEEAKAYVEKTGVDCLNVSISTVHSRMHCKPKLDYSYLKQINEALSIPLTADGSTGLSYDQFQQLIANGVAKINYSMSLSNAVTQQKEEISNADDAPDSFNGLMKTIRGAVVAEAENCMRLSGAAGRADEALAQCQPWVPVEHLIIYNVERLDRAGVETMMAEGRQVLSAIPGVREVFTGEAVKEDAKYRYTWLVRFCHPSVIDSYRDHPDHVAFANKLFRPVAGERISIDYKMVKEFV